MEFKKITINNQEFTYRLRRSFRARCLRLSVGRDGVLTAVLPERASEKTLEKFIQEKIDWIEDKVAKAKGKDPGLLAQGGYKDYILKKAAALRLAKSRLEHFNQVYGYKYKKVSIKNQKSRWGSCSGAGCLSFNYRIALLPPELADYLIVHELCHLGEMNHSRRFWGLVAKGIPGYVRCRKLLREI